MINSIAISLSHYQQTITIGVILTQKAIAVKIVYEANDGKRVLTTLLYFIYNLLKYKNLKFAPIWLKLVSQF